MALADISHAHHRPASPIAWDSLLGDLAGPATDAPKLPSLAADRAQHARRLQQMLVAGAMAAGGILAVATVMLLRLV